MADLTIGESPLNPSKPTDEEPISTHAGYIRETRRNIYYADIRNVVFESNVETGDAVFLDSSTNSWKRSLDDFTAPSRRKFHGIANVGDIQSVRVFGFMTYSGWTFTKDARVYVSSEEAGKLTSTEPEHNQPIVAGTAVQIDSILIDRQLSYWEDLKTEIWNARSTFDNLNARFDDGESRLDALEVEIGDAEGSFETLVLRLDDFESRITALEDATLDTRVTSLEDEVTTARDGETDLDTRIDRDYDTIASVQSEVQDARGSASSLDNRISISLNADGTLKSSTTASLWQEETDSAGKIDASSFSVNGDKSAIYLYGLVIRINEDDSSIFYVSNSTYDSGSDQTTVELLSDGLPSWPFVVEHSIPPDQFPRIDHSDVLNVLGAVEGTDSTKNKHVSNEQISSLASPAPSSLTQEGANDLEVLAWSDANTQYEPYDIQSDIPSESDIQSDIDSNISTHAAVTGAHHARYEDSEAVAAVGGTLNDSGTGTTDLWSADKIATQTALIAAASPAAASPAHYERDVKWTVKGNSTSVERYTLVSPSYLTININKSGYVLNSALELDLSDAGSWDDTSTTDWTVASNRAGKDFYVYACTPASGTDPDFILATNSTIPDSIPSGATPTEDNTRKVGGFHCLCADVGTISGHDLSDFNDGDILPQSIWCLNHRPEAEPEGMVYDPGTGKWADIYLASVQSGDLGSVNGATIADGGSAEAFHWYKSDQWFRRIKKRPPFQGEFVSLSLGSNQETNISGSADPGTTGGHSDSAGRRMISNIGCEDCCGVLYQWGIEAGPISITSNFADAYDSNDSDVAGQHKYVSSRPIYGGHWSDGSRAGSRFSYWSIPPLDLGEYRGARGVSEPLKRK